MFLANGPRIAGEGVVVGKPVVHRNRRRAIKPGEERQLLQMVDEAIRPGDARNVGASQRITNF